ncbi:MAG: rod shape-determining protein MreC [Limnochordia bacterium]
MGPKHWRWAALALVSLIVAGVISMTIGQRDSLSWPEVALREALAPLQSGVSRAYRIVADGLWLLSNLDDLARENEELRQEVEQLRTERMALLEARRENEELRQMLQLVRDTRSQMVVAEVIARAPNAWFSTLTIGKGAMHGLKKGMAVVTPEGVVGHIRSVTNHTAEVLLILDQRSALGARIHRTGEIVLVEGLGIAGEGRALVKPVSRETDIRPGDLLVTAGLSEIYPKGLTVGVVEEAFEGKYGLSRYGELKPTVDFSRLEWVAVLSSRLEWQ